MILFINTLFHPIAAVVDPWEDIKNQLKAGATSITIPDGITTIPAGIFNTSSGYQLKTIYFPHNNVVVEDKAFANTNLTELYNSEYVTNIGMCAFATYQGIKYYPRITWNFPNVKSVGSYAFAGARIGCILLSCSGVSLVYDALKNYGLITSGRYYSSDSYEFRVYVNSNTNRYWGAKSATYANPYGYDNMSIVYVKSASDSSYVKV